jgi:hypothetical protein
MSSADRSVIKCFSICGFLAGMVLYVLSFFGRTISDTAPILAGSFVLMVGLSLSMLILDPAIPFFRNRYFFWTTFWQDMPSWGRPVYILFVLFLMAQFLLVGSHGTPTVPVIVDGEPLIGANGQIVTAYTQAQQLHQDESFLRMFCSVMLVNYYQLLMYSLFPLRNE